MPTTFPAASGITAIDTRMAGREGLTSAYLLESEEPCLVESGPTNSADAVEEGLAELGVGPGDLAHIAVTHIHLDHAGGAGELARRFPRATVWVHERGAPHLVEPDRLVASATRIYGEGELARLFGPVLPVPADRVHALNDGDVLDLGGRRRLDVVYTPGHAGHQVAFVDSESEALFTGDALGVYLNDVRILRPATPPPEFDLELAVESIRAIAGREPSRLLFSHFGPADRVEHLCELAIRRAERWVDLVRDILRETDDLDRITELLEEATAEEFNPQDGDGGLVERYELLSSVRMNAMGIVRYLTRGGGRA